jgi:hypothetical protein
MNRPRPLRIVVLVALITAGCERRESASPTARPAAGVASTRMSAAPKVEVKVLSDGSLFVDGKPATLESIDRRFAALARVNGVVWYYRESGKSEPPAVATKVIALVIKHRLPISLSSQPDFSDTIDDQGLSRPRRSGE